MGRRAEFEAEHPEVHILSADQAGRVDLVMGALGWLGDEEQVTTCTSLGGESSTVMRVELQELRGGWRTAVLKQALPWLRRDESVAMPEDRARCGTALLPPGRWDSGGYGAHAAVAGRR